MELHTFITNTINASHIKRHSSTFVTGKTLQAVTFVHPSIGKNSLVTEMLRLIILASCAVAGISAACSEGYREEVATRCYRAKQNTFGDYVLYVPCPSGYTRVQNPSLCFKVSSTGDEKTYLEAMRECAKVQNGRLVDLDSPDKYGFVFGVVSASSKGVGYSKYNDYRLWIGLKRATSTGFQWNSGSMFVTNWAENQPTSSTRYNCGLMELEGLALQRCDRKIRYICEVPM
ncbi:uncharacterized protein [Haliotis cracherodii]|uniref:uncharacterized protein n=1 Tax=Haliotis cracherodii TaxID=6455 RepID=UPI0039ED64AC